MTLRERSDEELLTDVTKLVGSHRELTARFVEYLAEIEDRRLHLLKGFSSMFEFCTSALRFSEGEAFRRILAARLSRRFPTVVSLLASGSLNLTTLELLREWLTEENHEELFVAVAGKSKRDVQAFLVKRFPRPDRPSRIRHAVVEPLSEGRFAIEFTASEALREKLERCRDLMSHSNPSGDLTVVIERAVDLLLDDLERKRLARTTRPRVTREAREGDSAGISRVTRRAVFERDGVRCTFVADDGRRCESSAYLELDHIVPRAVGGRSDAENLRVRCRAHNQLWAEQVFGRERVERGRHFRQQKWKPEQHSEPPRGDCETRPMTTLEKVHAALRKMGFRDAEARRAVAAVVEKHDVHDPISVERTLREAVLVATAA